MDRCVHPSAWQSVLHRCQNGWRYNSAHGGSPGSHSCRSPFLVVSSYDSPPWKMRTEYARTFRNTQGIFANFVFGINGWSKELELDRRPNQSCMDLLFLKSIEIYFTYRSVQYSKSCSADFILQNLILRTRLCCTACILQPSCFFDFNLTEISQLEMTCLAVYQGKGISAGPALKYFTSCIGAG